MQLALCRRIHINIAFISLIRLKFIRLIENGHINARHKMTWLCTRHHSSPRTTLISHNNTNTSHSSNPFDTGLTKLSLSYAPTSFPDIIFKYSTKSYYLSLAMEKEPSNKSSTMGALSSIFKSKRLLIIQTISMLTFFASALAAWKLLSYTLNTTTPVVVILTYWSFLTILTFRGSMLPEYRRGDVLVVDNRFHSLKIADIVVYSIPGRDIPIVHRIHVIHNP